MVSAHMTLAEGGAAGGMYHCRHLRRSWYYRSSGFSRIEQAEASAIGDIADRRYIGDTGLIIDTKNMTVKSIENFQTVVYIKNTESDFKFRIIIV